MTTNPHSEDPALQERYYTSYVDYRWGSPHLTHLALYDRLVGMVRSAIRGLPPELPWNILELGAGHGAFTEPVLAMGANLTAVEMSAPSLAHLLDTFGCNGCFAGALDRDGTLASAPKRVSLVLAVSVLHHIPDYLGYLRVAADRVNPGGTILVLQDPLWYPRMGRAMYTANKAAYYFWRVRQGKSMQAVSTIIRRFRHVIDEGNPADMVEYHVVRSGVDEEAVVSLLREDFETVDLVKYWATQSAVCQRLGSWFGLTNTFGVLATRRRRS